VKVGAKSGGRNLLKGLNEGWKEIVKERDVKSYHQGSKFRQTLS